MFSTIFTIVVGVAIFGVILFLIVKKILKNKLNFYLNKNNRKN